MTISLTGATSAHVFTDKWLTMWAMITCISMKPYDIEIVEDHDDDEECLPLEKAKSPVWKHFGFKAKDSQFVKDEWKRTTMYCTICKNPLSYKGNMTNLMVHLQYHHRAEFRKKVEAQEKEKVTSKFWCAGSATTTRSAYYRTLF